MSGSTHLERTKGVVRTSMALSDAVVEDIYNISPTIKLLKITLNNLPSITFKPGQWVDFHIPGLDVVGGYSMCSTPKLLMKKNQIHLAVKQSDHAPAHWIHTQCKPGSKVQLKVGGDVIFDLREWKRKDQNLLLIAGGIGINPLLSIFQNNYEVIEEKKTSKDDGKYGRTSLLYSATTLNELVFKKEIETITSRDQHFKATYFVSKVESCCSEDGKYIGGRITPENLKEAITTVTSEKDDFQNLLVYLCGPPMMMSNMKDHLLRFGVDEENIKYESWW